jgi:hypothetical protein
MSPRLTDWSFALAAVLAFTSSLISQETGQHRGIAGNGSSVKLGLGTQPEQSRPAATPPIIAPKPATKHVGERGLGRDSVGEASALPSRKGAGCSFAGKIELLPRQMEAASVFHIECPQCLAVREAHPKGDRVTFS